MARPREQAPAPAGRKTARQESGGRASRRSSVAKAPVDRSIAFDQRIDLLGDTMEVVGALGRRADQRLRAAAGVRRSWFHVLLRIARAPEQQLTMRELGAVLGLTSGGITRFFDGMVAAGYVVRTELASDRRVVAARLTDAGWDVLAQAIAVEVELAEELLEPLNERERATLGKLLAKLRDASS